MRSVLLSGASVAAITALALTACKVDAQQSYCEALCTWASTCAADETGGDAAALEAECLDATRATDDSCAEAEGGEMNKATSKLLTKCTDAITSASDDCSAFSGRIDEMSTATPPAACATSQGGSVNDTFNTAQESVMESGDELCERYTATFCDSLQECVLGALGVEEIPADLITAAGGTPFELCEARLETNTSSCASDGIYEPGDSLTDINETREFARDCLVEFDALTCDDILGGNLTSAASCAGSRSDFSDYSGALFEIAGEYIE